MSTPSTSTPKTDSIKPDKGDVKDSTGEKSTATKKGDVEVPKSEAKVEVS